MAFETWLIKVKTAISNSFEVARPAGAAPNPRLIKKSNVGVLAFEIAGLMSKLLHLWQSLLDKNIVRLRNESISLEGVHKIVSNDEAFLLGLACAEFSENLRLVAKSVSRISKKCEEPSLRCFERLFDEFANWGRDPHSWVLSLKEMDARIKKMDRYVSLTATLHREMDELSVMESGLSKSLLKCQEKESSNISELQQKIYWQRQEIKYLKERSLWNRSFDTVVSLLSRSIFTILARIKLVFGIGICPESLTRSLSASATVHPSDHHNPSSNFLFVSGPLMKSSKLDEKKDHLSDGFFESNSKLLKPPETTLGAAALALHYSNLIIVMEKMIKSPQLVGLDAREDLYAMLPNSIRSMLRDRLKGSTGISASDPVLAGEWREALGRILSWLSPLAHNMIRWQSERSFEQQTLVPKTNVMLLQTLFFANKEKTEAAITELLVGLNYIWKFEREMTAKALFESTNFNGMNLNAKNAG